MRIKEGGPDTYDSIELIVDVAIPRFTAYRPEKPNFKGELSEWEKEKIAAYNEAMEKYTAQYHQWETDLKTVYSLCLEPVTIERGNA